MLLSFLTSGQLHVGLLELLSKILPQSFTNTFTVPLLWLALHFTSSRMCVLPL